MTWLAELFHAPGVLAYDLALIALMGLFGFALLGDIEDKP